MKANGTTYSPLAMSNSGSSEENLFTAGRRPARRARKLRSRRLQVPDTEIAAVIRKRARWAAAAAILTFVIIIWLAVLTYFAVTLRAEEFALRADVASASAGVRALPAALQDCHSATAALRIEQSSLSSHLLSLNSTLVSLSSQLPQLVSRISAIETKPHETVPVPASSLSETVAALGAELHDLRASFAQVRETQTRTDEIIHSLNATVRSLNMSFLQHPTTHPTTQLPNTNVDDLKDKLVALNSSINARLKALDSDLRHGLAAVDQLGEERANLSSQVASLAAELGQQQHCLESISASATTLSTSHNCDQRYHKLEDLIVNLSRNVTSAFKNTAQLTKELSELKKQVTTLSTNPMPSLLHGSLQENSSANEQFGV